MLWWRSDMLLTKLQLGFLLVWLQKNLIRDKTCLFQWPPQLIQLETLSLVKFSYFCSRFSNRIFKTNLFWTVINLNLVICFSGSSREFAGFSTEMEESVINSIWERALDFFPKLKEHSLSDFIKRREVRVGLRPYSEFQCVFKLLREPLLWYIVLWN